MDLRRDGKHSHKFGEMLEYSQAQDAEASRQREAQSKRRYTLRCMMELVIYCSPCG